MEPTSPAGPPRRPVRSFVRRAGRLTHAQARALGTLWPRYGIPYTPAPLDFQQLFGRRAPVTLEIGFGNGDALLSQAAGLPERDFIGVEVHEPGVGHCLLGLEAGGLHNVRLICHDALDVLRHQIPPGSLDRVNLWFPDPWPKKRHHKRRIVQPDFVAEVAAALAPGGHLHVATDWPDYAAHIDLTLSASPAFGAPLPAAGDRPRTRFEARGERLGHPVQDRVYRRL